MGRPAAHPCCSGHTHSTPLQTGEPRGPGQTSGWQQRPLRDQRGPSRASRGAPQGGQGSSGAVLAGVILTDVDSCVPPPELFRFRQEPGGQHDAFRPGHPWRPVHGPWAAVGSPHPQPPRRPGAHGLPVLPADLAGVRPRDGPQGVFGEVRTGQDQNGSALNPPSGPACTLPPTVIFRRQLLGRVLPCPGDKGQARRHHAPGDPGATGHRGWGGPPVPSLGQEAQNLGC